MTYDQWKSTNPADEYLGPNPDDEEDDVTIPCSFTPLEANEAERLLMLDTLKLIRERLSVQMGTDADLIDDIERHVNATLAAVEEAPL